MRCTLLVGALTFVLGTPAAQAAVSIDDIEVDETNGTVSATFTVKRTAGLLTLGGTTVAYTTADGSARAPGDYAAESGTLSFGSLVLGGTRTQRLTILVRGDRLDESIETFGVRLSGAEVTKGEGVASIVDDDPLPTVSVGDAAAAPEGAAATFTIALSAPSGRDVAVAFSTANGSALAGQDYTESAGTIAIPTGATSASVGVPLHDDSADEPDEAFELRIGAPSATTLGDASGVGTIVDGDVPGAAPPPAPFRAPPSAGGSSTNTALPQLGISSPRLRRPATVVVTVSCPRSAGRCNGRLTIFSRRNPRSRIKALRRFFFFFCSPTTRSSTTPR